MPNDEIPMVSVSVVPGGVWDCRYVPTALATRYIASITATRVGPFAVTQSIHSTWPLDQQISYAAGKYLASMHKVNLPLINTIFHIQDIFNRFLAAYDACISKEISSS